VGKSICSFARGRLNKGVCHASTELVQVDIPTQIIELCGFYVVLLSMLPATPWTLPNVILLMFFFGLSPKMLDLASGTQHQHVCHLEPNYTTEGK